MLNVFYQMTGGNEKILKGLVLSIFNRLIGGHEMSFHPPFQQLTM